MHDPAAAPVQALDPAERELTERMLERLGDYEARLFVDDTGLTADWSLELR